MLFKAFSLPFIPLYATIAAPQSEKSFLSTFADAFALMKLIFLNVTFEDVTLNILDRWLASIVKPFPSMIIGESINIPVLGIFLSASES